MAAPGPQSPYPSSGPSNYYQHPPPGQHYAYGGQNPTPYPYQYPIPPMTGPPAMHSSTPERLNGQGRGSFPQQVTRGGYQQYHPVAHHPYPPQPAPGPFSPSHGKYPQQQIPFSPPYTLQPPNGQFSPSWQVQESISPLPKQLSMPPPKSPVPSSLPSQNDEEKSLAPQPSTESVASEPSSSLSSADVQQLPELQHPQPQTAASPNLKNPSSPRPSSTQTNSGSVSGPRTGQWAIWSRRPRNPAHAPGIIISPLARPPQDVIQNALELPTPPVSPSPSEEETLSKETEDNSINAEKESTPDQNEIPSSSATDTTPSESNARDTPVPGSPLSSHTSVSASAIPAKDNEPEISIGQPSVEAVTVSEAEEQPTPVVPPEAAIERSVAEPSIAQSSVSESFVVESAPAPAPVPPPMKKSWASLLKSGDSGASSSKSSLPISSVVGFSIPADSLPSSSPPLSIAATKKNELVALLTSAVSAPPGSAPRIRPRGLVNSGNMCFANAVLQMLVYTPPFYYLFTELGKYLQRGQTEKGTLSPLVDATIQFLKEFSPAPPSPEIKVNGKAKGREIPSSDYDNDGLDSFVPSYIWDALKENRRFDNMRGGHQEDAEEFLGFFLDTLEEELQTIFNSLTEPGKSKAADSEDPAPQEDGWLEVRKRNKSAITRTVKSTDSPIRKIFGGKSRLTLRAPFQKESITIDDWRALRLDIQPEQINTVKDALRYIAHLSPVQVTNSTKPGLVIDANQHTLLDTLPPILILHMKRFLYDTNVGDVVKLAKQVAFSPELEIGSDLMAPTRKMHATRYKLFGVVYHHGQSASGGHYTLDVLHPNRDLSNKPREAWIRIDDELLSDIRPDDVFGSSEREDKCAYLLFYRRVGGLPRT